MTNLPIPEWLASEMQQTEQNPSYHAEGSVLAHTEMVVEKFHSLSGHFELTENEKNILYWASVLHDTGKTVTTDFKSGRWRSRGHERASVPIARDILLSVPGMDAQTRNRILSLIRFHGVPLRFMRLNFPFEEIQILSTITDLRLLSVFTVFDFEGRICEDHEGTMKMITGFREFHVPKAEFELGKHSTLQQIWKNWPLHFRNAAWKAFLIKRPELIAKMIDENAQSLDQPKKKVFLTLGASLSGKSTWLGKNRPGVFIIKLSDFGLNDLSSANEFNLERKSTELKYLLSIYLRHHDEIYIDGNHLDKLLRMKLNEIIRDLGAEIHYLVFEEKLETLIERNQGKENPLSNEELKNSWKNLSVLHPWEAHETHYLMNIE